MVKTQFKSDIQILRFDNGREFVNTSMKEFCQKRRIIHQTTCAHTPEQNEDIRTGKIIGRDTERQGLYYVDEVVTQQGTTFSHVAKIDTIRVLFSIAANKGWPLHQFDVKNAFLHGELKEEVYMDPPPPPGFVESLNPSEVCRLKKSLYGLKQSLRAWFGRFTLAMRKYGFKQSNSDHTLFLKRKGKLITCLIIYVDDMIITGNDEEEMTRLRTNLFKEFEMKDLGKLEYFLGIEVLRYLKGTPGHGVLFKANGHLETQVYTDADWAGDKGDQISTSDYFTLVGGNLVT
nr:putative ribonuclease H-like domain-containing protein [Tanacetum cinerariifolium]